VPQKLTGIVKLLKFSLDKLSTRVTAIEIRDEWEPLWKEVTHDSTARNGASLRGCFSGRCMKREIKEKVGSSRRLTAKRAGYRPRERERENEGTRERKRGKNYFCQFLYYTFVRSTINNFVRNGIPTRARNVRERIITLNRPWRGEWRNVTTAIAFFPGSHPIGVHLPTRMILAMHTTQAHTSIRAYAYTPALLHMTATNVFRVSRLCHRHSGMAPQQTYVRGDKNLRQREIATSRKG